jgi:hypothetical protein
MAASSPDTDPYPEPAAPPEPPREEDPAIAPIEDPHAPPFGDTGPTVDRLA